MKCQKHNIPMQRVNLKHTTYVGPHKWEYYCPKCDKEARINNVAQTINKEED